MKVSTMIKSGYKDCLRYNKKLAFISWVFVIGWMIVIFILSAQPAAVSNNNSNAAAKAILKATEPVHRINVDKDTSEARSLIRRFNKRLREYAHSGVFLVLALLVINALKRSRIKGLRAYGASSAICVLYALSDEVHQLFVPGRAFQLFDLSMDFIGAVLGMLIFHVALVIIKSLARANTRVLSWMESSKTK